MCKKKCEERWPCFFTQNKSQNIWCFCCCICAFNYSNLSLCMCVCVSTHRAEFEAVLNLLHFTHSLLDHLLKILHSLLHLDLHGVKQKSNLGFVIFTQYDTFLYDSLQTCTIIMQSILCVPSSSHSRLLLWQPDDLCAPSRCRSGTHTSVRPDRTSPTTSRASCTSSLAGPSPVRSACGASMWRLSGEAAGGFHSTRSSRPGRTSGPLPARTSRRRHHIPHHLAWLQTAVKWTNRVS